MHDVDPGGECAPEVNISERNAALLAGLLGFTPTKATGAPLPARDDVGPASDAGQVPAEDFLGRVLVAPALTPEDEGVDGYWNGRIHMGGRRAGYLQTRLAELRDLAQWCVARGRDVAWG